jgi:SAM-dependent methyltransferase
LRLVPPRSSAPELLDRGDNTRADLEGALRDIRTVNRLLGGSRALLGALRPLILSCEPDQTLELLDVGTGAADLPLAMARCAANLGREIRITAVDLDPTTATIAARLTARSPQIRVVCGDALDLPFRPNSFDIVTASMFLHHFDQTRVGRLLARFVVLARRAVLVNDLRRHLVPWGFVTLVSRISGRHPMFVHDAPLSVLRGFTADELSRAARDSGAASVELRRRWPFRLALTLRCMTTC